MKTQIQILLACLVLACSTTTFAQTENDRLGSRMKHVAVFKKSLIIPYETLKPVRELEALRNTIEKSGEGRRDNYVAIMLVDGEVVRTTNMFSRLNAGGLADFELVSQKREISMAFGLVEEDLSYCVLYVNASALHREDAKGHYVFSPKQEMFPYLEPNSRARVFNVNSGTITEEHFGMFVELKPSERPNELTHVGRSREISTFTCYRYAAKNRGLRAQDFVQILGTENIELRTK